MIINVEKHLAQRLAASIMREIDLAQTKVHSTMKGSNLALTTAL